MCQDDTVKINNNPKVINSSSDKSSMEINNKRHPFSYTLGPGPYRFVGYFELMIPNESNHGRNNYHLAPKTESGCGTCAHCGRGIIHNYIVLTGEGKRYAVGSECILKCNNGGDITNMSQFEKQLRLEKRRKGQESRERRRVKLAGEVKALIDTNETILKALPHPSEYQAGKGLTAYDYCTFCYRNGHITLGAIGFLKNKLKNWVNA